MSALNLSQDGTAINKSYQIVVDSTLPSGGAAVSPTYGQWAIYSVQAPLAGAFQSDSGKESVLKVFRTGEGELVDLVDEFSDGKIQFAYVKVKDPNSALPKNVLIAWCGEGVPERTKGYFTSHLNAVSSLLRGYHVQVTARGDADLTPDIILQKVSDASGSKYTTASAGKPAPPPPITSKPAFTPSRVGGASTSFNPMAQRSRQQAEANTDQDGWGEDAPQVTRSQLTKVESAYKPTKVNMAELTSQKQAPVRVMPPTNTDKNDAADVVKGNYQPIGKVDIAAIRREAQQKGSAGDDRPSTVRGSYEPVGKVDIAAIRARAQPTPSSTTSPPTSMSPAQTGSSHPEQRSFPDRTIPLDTGRLTSMPKPKVANRFGAGASSFTGTTAPAPGGFDAKPAPAAPVGVASRTFADEGGKTPAQIWAERKARQSGGANPQAGEASRTAPIVSQASGSAGQWESGYSGKKWGSVQTTKTGQSAASGLSQDRTGEQQTEEENAAPSGGVSSIRDKFANTAPMGGAASFDDQADAPPPPMASRPTAVLPTPPRQPRSPTPPTPDDMERSGSPIRIIQPVGRGNTANVEPPEERFSPPSVPGQSMSAAIPHADELEDDDQPQVHDPARAAAVQAATTSFGATAVGSAEPTKGPGGKRAVIQYDYEKAEDNELELREGEYVSNIEMVDEDWWMGENQHGETGLFPSNYVELVEDEAAENRGAHHEPEPEPALESHAAAGGSGGNTATAQYEYEAAEDNELSFPDGAKIHNVEFPDEDWWLGEYDGRSGLFPSNYVELDE